MVPPMSHRIFVVDDDPSVCSMLSRFLGQGLGYEVETAEDGEQAIEAAMKQTFDLCILDVRMPGISGSEVYARLKTMQPGIEAIFFTADNEFEQTMDFLRFALPSDRVLVKPLKDFSRLTQLIVGILGPPVR
jgi:CheY-like chemotaxis protein